MKTRLTNFFDRLRSTYWFLPALMVVAVVVLSIVTIKLDRLLRIEAAGVWGIYAGGPEGARTLLSAVAGSMITVAGVIFSITIVALSLASSQFGPRLLSNFMRDTVNQFVLGTYISTFVYCLLILRTIRDLNNGVFVPHVSISVAVLLTMFSLGVLIYFIHHVSTSIQAETVINSVSRELNDAIDRLYPKEKGYGVLEPALRDEGDIPEDFEKGQGHLPVPKSGYLQVIDYFGLVTIARDQNLVLRVEPRIGEFVARENVLLSYWPGAPLDDEVIEQIKGAFIIGPQRLQTRDVNFAVSQLVEIAVRALSPGINDPHTVMSCVDRLGAALANLAERSIPSGYHYDDKNNLRLIAKSLTFRNVVDNAFNQIRQYGRSSVAVMTRLLEAIAVIAAHTQKESDRMVLRRHADMIKRASEEAIPEPWDREDVEERYQTALRILEE